MTDLEKRARAMMSRDSGPNDPSWDESEEEDKRQYMLEATDERAYAYSLAEVMAYREHASGVTDEDIEWYQDLVLGAIITVKRATRA